MIKKEFRAYKRAYFFASIIIGFFYRVKVRGRENIPSGAALICANHSSWADPFLIAFAVKNREHLHMMAKKEIFDKKIIGSILRSIGTFPVNRGGSDIEAVRTTMRYLKNGEKVVIFPEGTRRRGDNEVEAKSGAVRIAEKTGSPILPVYIPRRKKTFGTVYLIIGKPYYINSQNQKLTTADYTMISSDLMEQINRLGTGGKGQSADNNG